MSAESNTVFPWRCEDGNCRSTHKSNHEYIYDPQPIRLADETASEMAERYVAAFMGDAADAVVQRDRLVEMVTNAITESGGSR